MSKPTTNITELQEAVKKLQQKLKNSPRAARLGGPQGRLEQ